MIPRGFNDIVNSTHAFRVRNSNYLFKSIFINAESLFVSVLKATDTANRFAESPKCRSKSYLLLSFSTITETVSVGILNTL